MTDVYRRCAACRIARPLVDLIVITDRGDPDLDPWYACRSSIPDGPRRDCLAFAAGPRRVHAIALADDGDEAWHSWTAWIEAGS